MKQAKFLAFLLACSLCFSLAPIHTQAAPKDVDVAVSDEDTDDTDESEDTEDEDSAGDTDDGKTEIGDLFPDEKLPDNLFDYETIEELIDEYLSADISVTPTLRDDYFGIETKAVSSSAVTVSVTKTVYEMIADGFVPYEIQWRIGSYFADKSQYVNVTAENLTPGTEYVIVAQVHYKNPETLTTHWLNLSTKVKTEGMSPASVETPPVAIATPTPVVVPVTPPSVAVAKPCKVKARFVGDTVSAKWQGDAGSYEYRVTDKSGKIVKSGYSMGPYFYSYNIKNKAKLAVSIRGRIWDEQSNQYSYSQWSKKKWVIKQPLAKLKKAKKHSITVTWDKIAGAVKYRVYVRKHGIYKWQKAKTVKKCRALIKKYKGKKLNPKKKKYDVKIVAVGKAGGKTIVSDKSRYRKMHK